MSDLKEKILAKAQECVDILSKKEEKYVQNDDPYWTVKQIAIATRKTPLGILNILLMKHIITLQTYCNNPSSISPEEVKKATTDIINYVCLIENYKIGG